MKRLVPCLALAATLLGLGTETANASTLFGLIDTGELYSSTDQGVSWSAVSTLPVRDAVALGAGVSSAELYLASRSGVIYRSTNAGAGWSAVGSLPVSDVADLLIRADLSILLLTATGSVHRSADQGASFTALAALTGSDFVSLTQTLPNQRLYALTRSGGVFESLNGGAIWTAKGTFSAPDAVELRALGATLYALTGTGDVYRSTDAAASWTAVGTLSQVGMTGLTRDGATLLATTRAGEVATSVNGATWTWKGAIGQLVVMALGVDTPATTGVSPGTLDPAAWFAPPWPNPVGAGHGVHLALRLPTAQRVSVDLYDLVGRRAASRAPEILPPGLSGLLWRPEVRRSGLYWLSVRTEAGLAARAKLVVLP